MSFSDKVVLVTGSSSGIGAATALAFAREGAKVVIVGRSHEKVEKVAAKFAGLHTPLTISADVSDDHQAASLIQKTIDHFGKLDVLVNNAGISRPATVLQGNLLAAYDEVLATNLRAAIHLTTLATPHLIKTKGNIINMASVVGVIPPSDLSFLASSVSKAGLIHFTKGAALELAPHGVRVNVISPGPVRTDILDSIGTSATWEDFQKLTALNRVSEPDELADLILFLASDKAKSITGCNYVIDNGMLLK
ncbi:3-oxoacyl-[acyl-carrier-protein] reductase FabG-like [Manduca sexta]|uniref:3-oxoacyl-[acyl-carrier-protein] reductase FabG-like n=1 Tax=Manduca sexta TaxID=7130 RepID=UPI00188F8177|nr:3-oxoacyl-[acyl-carrier-protein] reductase FabG-like [Manduca sexta]